MTSQWDEYGSCKYNQVPIHVCVCCQYVYVLTLEFYRIMWLCTYVFMYACLFHVYIYIYMSPVPGPPHPPLSPPNGIPPPLLTPPTPPKPSICMLFAHIHTYTHIYSPFHPSNLASLRYLQHLRATTSSTDLVYLYISIITFFSNRL